MGYLTAAAVMVFVGLLAVFATRALAGHKIKKGMLVVKTGDRETAISMDDIVEVFEIDKEKEISIFQKYIVRPYMKKERVAVFTRSNVSYLFVLRNPDRLVKSVKAQNPAVFVKVKAV